MWMCGICFFQTISGVPGLGFGEWPGATAAELEGEGVNNNIINNNNGAASGAEGSPMVSAQDYGKVLAKITRRLAKDTAKIDSLETKVDDAEETNEELSAKYKAIFKAKVRRGEGLAHLPTQSTQPNSPTSICPKTRLRFGKRHTSFPHCVCWTRGG